MSFKQFNIHEKCLRAVESQGLTEPTPIQREAIPIVLKNHMHIIAQSTDLRRDVGRFKSYTAKQVWTYLKENQVKKTLDPLAFYKKAHKSDRSYQFWQEGVHPEFPRGLKLRPPPVYDTRGQ